MNRDNIFYDFPAQSLLALRLVASSRYIGTTLILLMGMAPASVFSWGVDLDTSLPQSREASTLGEKFQNFAYDILRTRLERDEISNHPQISEPVSAMSAKYFSRLSSEIDSGNISIPLRPEWWSPKVLERAFLQMLQSDLEIAQDPELLGLFQVIFSVADKNIRIFENRPLQPEERKQIVEGGLIIVSDLLARQKNRDETAAKINPNTVQLMERLGIFSSRYFKPNLIWREMFHNRCEVPEGCDSLPATDIPVINGIYSLQVERNLHRIRTSKDLFLDDIITELSWLLKKTQGDVASRMDPRVLRDLIRDFLTEPKMNSNDRHHMIARVGRDLQIHPWEAQSIVRALQTDTYHALTAMAVSGYQWRVEPSPRFKAQAPIVVFKEPLLKRMRGILRSSLENHTSANFTVEEMSVGTDPLSELTAKFLELVPQAEADGLISVDELKRDTPVEAATVFYKMIPREVYHDPVLQKHFKAMISRFADGMRKKNLPLDARFVEAALESYSLVVAGLAAGLRTQEEFNELEGLLGRSNNFRFLDSVKLGPVLADGSIHSFWKYWLIGTTDEVVEKLPLSLRTAKDIAGKWGSKFVHLRSESSELELLKSAVRSPLVDDVLKDWKTFLAEIDAIPDEEFTRDNPRVAEILTNPKAAQLAAKPELHNLRDAKFEGMSLLGLQAHLISAMDWTAAGLKVSDSQKSQIAEILVRSSPDSISDFQKLLERDRIRGFSLEQIKSIYDMGLKVLYLEAQATGASLHSRVRAKCKEFVSGAQ